MGSSPHEKTLYVFSLIRMMDLLVARQLLIATAVRGIVARKPLSEKSCQVLRVPTDSAMGSKPVNDQLNPIVRLNYCDTFQ